MDKPELTVLMPVYNEARYLKASIQSILDQTIKDFEFLILNDDSSDNSEEIIQSFKDNRIKYVKTPRMKLSALLNYGVNISEGSIIARMDSDDIAVNDRLEKQMNFIRNKDKNFISSAWFATFKGEKLFNIVRHPVNDEEIKKALNTSNPICHPLAIFHKEFFKQLNGYDEDLECLEDHNLWLHARNKAEFGNIPEVLLLKREKSNSLGAIEKALPRSTIFNMLYTSFDDSYYSDYKSSKKDKIELEYLYGDQFNLRRRLKTYRFFSLRHLYLYLLTYLPEKFFIKKGDAWIKWKLNRFASLFSTQKRSLKAYLKKFA